MAFVWERPNVGYGARYGCVGVRGYIETFCDGIGEAGLSEIVEHRDGVAAKMEEGSPR